MCPRRPHTARDAHPSRPSATCRYRHPAALRSLVLPTPEGKLGQRGRQAERSQGAPEVLQAHRSLRLRGPANMTRH
eukprot:5127381-Alexandrium_andersonii.AAC.1